MYSKLCQHCTENSQSFDFDNSANQVRSGIHNIICFFTFIKYFVILSLLMLYFCLFSHTNKYVLDI